MPTLNKLYTIGWYGSCDTQPCVDYDLDPALGNNANIEAAFRVITDSTAGNGYEAYVKNQHGSGTNAFESLQCGHAYIIKLTSDSVSVTIPDFVISNNSSTPDGYIAQDCAQEGESGNVPTATPVASPTPTPTLPPTGTPVPTATQANTPTPTPTATQASTPVPTGTPVPTPTATQVGTPIPTGTPVPTPTPTATQAVGVSIETLVVHNPDTGVRDETIDFGILPTLSGRASKYRVLINGVEVIPITFSGAILAGDTQFITGHDVSGDSTGVDHTLTVWLVDDNDVDIVSASTTFQIPDVVTPPTPTPTQPATPTPTPTATQVVTPTPTPTVTQTATPTPTPTATQAKTSVNVSNSQNFTTQKPCAGSPVTFTVNTDSGDNLTELTLSNSDAGLDSSEFYFTSSGTQTLTVSDGESISISWDANVLVADTGNIVIKASHPGNSTKLALAETTITGGSTVTITKPAGAISWSQDLSSLTPNQPVTLDATSSTGQTITYQSSDANVATINGDQLTAGGTSGTATITATAAADQCNLEASTTQSATIPLGSSSLSGTVSETIDKTGVAGDSEGPSTQESELTISATNAGLLTYWFENNAADNWEYKIVSGVTTVVDWTAATANSQIQTPAQALVDGDKFVFRLKAKTDWTAGSYDASFTLSGANGSNSTATLTGTVNAAPTATLAWSAASSTGAGYEEGSGETGTAVPVTLSGTNLHTSDVTITLGGADSSAFEWSEASDFSTQISGTTSTQTFSTINSGKLFYVRLKSGQSAGTYNCSLTASSGDVSGSETTSVQTTVTSASVSGVDVTITAGTSPTITFADYTPDLATYYPEGVSDNGAGGSWAIQPTNIEVYLKTIGGTTYNELIYNCNQSDGIDGTASSGDEGTIFDVSGLAGDVGIRWIEDGAASWPETGNKRTGFELRAGLTAGSSSEGTGASNPANDLTFTIVIS